MKCPDASKQAFSQARQKLSPEVFKLLNNKLITEFYSDNAIETFKGLRVLAVDGSVICLPTNTNLQNEYDTASNNRSISGELLQWPEPLFSLTDSCYGAF